jgi:hypothetical protein
MEVAGLGIEAAGFTGARPDVERGMELMMLS